MSLVSHFFIAVGLSADAFAVNVARGAAARNVGMRAAARSGCVFGLVEAGMVLMGWLLGSGFAELITGVDHWIALLLLGAVGGHMIHEGMQSDMDVSASGAGNGKPKLLLAAIGTSIDGAAIGITFAFIPMHIGAAVAIIGGVSFCVSTLGLLIGPRVGTLLGRRAEILGGGVLIAIGVSIFYSHVQEALPF
ncbi:manganese efflux pump MntP [Halomonas sp. WWR20]